MSDANNIQKQMIIVSILNTRAKNGMSVGEIMREYEEMEGCQLGTNMIEVIQLLDSFEKVQNVQGKYFSISEKSSHISKLVQDQKENKKKSSYSGQHRVAYPTHENKSQSIYSRRKSICYGEDYVNVDFQHLQEQQCSTHERSDRQHNQIQRSGKISERRQTLGPSRYRPLTPSRSRSGSPNNDNDRRSKYEDRSNSTYSHKKRCLSPSTKGSPSSKRNCSSENQQRQSRIQYHSYDHVQDRRSHSKRRSSSRSNSLTNRDHSRIQGRSSSTRIDMSSGDVVRSVDVPSSAEVKNRSINQSITNKQNVPRKTTAREFKFNVIGDGMIYYLMHQLNAEAKFPEWISTELLLTDAIQHVQNMMNIRRSKSLHKKMIILSIGKADLRNGTSLTDMRKLFFTLFTLVKSYGFEPLVTTIYCIDTPEMSLKAKFFNSFLKRHFNNVVDMETAPYGGFAQALANLSISETKPVNSTITFGMRNRLVLKVEY